MSLWLSHQAAPQNCFSSTKEAAYSALAEVGAQRKPTKVLFLWQDTNHLWLFLSELNWDPLLCFLLSQNATEKNLNLEEQSPTQAFLTQPTHIFSNIQRNTYIS